MRARRRGGLRLRGFGELQFFNALFEVAHVGEIPERDGFYAVKALRQFTPRVNNLFERLFPDRLCVISARFKFLQPRVAVLRVCFKLQQAPIKTLKTRVYLLQTGIRVQKVLRRLDPRKRDCPASRVYSLRPCQRLCSSLHADSRETKPQRRRPTKKAPLLTKQRPSQIRSRAF